MVVLTRCALLGFVAHIASGRRSADHLVGCLTSTLKAVVEHVFGLLLCLVGMTTHLGVLPLRR